MRAIITLSLQFFKKGVHALRLLVFLLCIVAIPTAFAQSSPQNAEGKTDLSEPFLSVSGFGTAGLAHATESQADFLAHDLQRRGAGRNGNWSAEVDTRVGVQLDIRPTANLSAVVQVTSEQRYDGSYDPEFEWANVKYQITPDLSVRAGRIVLPIFLHSDSRKVGYAMPWVRPPVELYSLLPLSRITGVDSSWRGYLGSANNTLQVVYGSGSARLPEDEVKGGKLDADDGWGVTDTFEYGNTTLRATYLRVHGTITSYNQLFDGYRTYAALVPVLALQTNALIDKYEPNNKIFTVFAIGASYNPGKWFVMGEYGVADTNSLYGKRSGWYMTSGYRIRDVTPYLTYAESHLDSNSYDAGVPGATTLNAELNTQLSAAPVQKTISVGMRWDCANNLALKVQYDYTDIADGSPGTLDHQTSAYQNGGQFHVYSIVLDFLF